MADTGDQGAPVPATASSARRRRVDGDVTSTPPDGPAGRRPRPWLWTAVVAVVVLGAVASSFLLDDEESTTVDLAGVDLSAFCAAYRTEVEPLAAGDVTLDVATAGDAFRQRAAAYRRVAAVAPDQLVDDVEQLAEGLEGLAERADELAASEEEVPGAGALDLSSAMTEAEADLAVPAQRVERAVAQGCAPVVPGTTPGTIP